MGTALLLTTLAGLSTIIGGLIVFLFKKENDEYLCVGMGFAAGVMIYISFVELLVSSFQNLKYIEVTLAFFGGMLIFYFIDVFTPHFYTSECTQNPKLQKKCELNELKRCGKFVTLGIFIHNLPEGIIVFFSTMVDIKFGIAIAIAIMMHNIPEGLAIGLPIYYSTKSKMLVLWYTFLAGIAEPIGALLAYLILYKYITKYSLNLILAATAGIMVFISFDELLPQAYKYKDTHKIILGIFLGMLITAVTLYFL